eukprot:1160060-Pelagomonas_calceolata.AAC.6
MPHASCQQHARQCFWRPCTLKKRSSACTRSPGWGSVAGLIHTSTKFCCAAQAYSQSAAQLKHTHSQLHSSSILTASCAAQACVSAPAQGCTIQACRLALARQEMIPFHGYLAWTAFKWMALSVAHRHEGQPATFRSVITEIIAGAAPKLLWRAWKCLLGADAALQGLSFFLHVLINGIPAVEAPCLAYQAVVNAPLRVSRFWSCHAQLRTEFLYLTLGGSKSHSVTRDYHA